MKKEAHLKVAFCHQWIAIVLILLLMMTCFFAAVVANKPGSTRYDALRFLQLGLILLTLVLVHVVLSAGSFKRLKWARYGTLLLSVFLLFAFPVGTVLGIYLLLNTFEAWIEPKLINQRKE